MVMVADRISPNGMSKIERYGWTIKDKPGVLVSISKHELRIDPEYQRSALPAKIKAISSAWSWIACGAIIVGLRSDAYWVIDGQHRVLAAMRRVDITDLPCVVFETETVQEEATGFLNLNDKRKAMSSIDRLRAMIASGDAVAIQFNELCADLDVRITSTATSGGTMKSAKWGVNRMGESPVDTRIVLALAAEMSHADNEPIQERLLEGLWYIHKHCNVDLNGPRLRKRIKQIGTKTLVDAAYAGASFYSRGGARSWAAGMMNAINKGLQVKFTLKTDSEE
jgi:hypothetical protein